MTIVSVLNQQIDVREIQSLSCPTPGPGKLETRLWSFTVNLRGGNRVEFSDLGESIVKAHRKLSTEWSFLHRTQ